MRMKTKVKHTSITDLKRKVHLESEAKVKKITSNGKHKKPLKNYLLVELKELQEKYKIVEDKSIKDIQSLTNLNRNLEDSNKILVE